MDSQTIEIRLDLLEKRSENQKMDIDVMLGRIKWMDEVLKVIVECQNKIAVILDR